MFWLSFFERHHFLTTFYDSCYNFFTKSRIISLEKDWTQMQISQDVNRS